MLTAYQLNELHKMSVTQLKEMYTKFKSQSKKKTKKEDLVQAISTMVALFNEMRQNLTGGQIKPHTIESYDKLNIVDLRQIHASFRRVLQCSKYNKDAYINCIINLARQMDYFVQY